MLLFVDRKNQLMDNTTKVKTLQNKMGIKPRHGFIVCLQKGKAYKLKAVLREKTQTPSSY